MDELSAFAERWIARERSIGPLLAAAIVARFGLRSVFVWTLIPGVWRMLIAFCVREEPHRARRKPLWGSIQSLPVAFRRYLIGVGIAGIGDFSNTLLILWATQALDAGTGAWARGPAGHAVLRRLQRRLHLRRATRAAGWPTAFRNTPSWRSATAWRSIPAIALAMPGTSLTKFAIVFAVSGLYMGVWETLENATAAELLPAESRGIGFGVLATVNGIGDFVSSAAVGCCGASRRSGRWRWWPSCRWSDRRLSFAPAGRPASRPRLERWPGRPALAVELCQDRPVESIFDGGQRRATVAPSSTR